MNLFFDIQHRGDLYLDDEGEHFKSLDAACGHLARVLCEFVDTGGELDDIRDMVVDNTDRVKVRLIVPIIDILPQPIQRAA